MINLYNIKRFCKESPDLIENYQEAVADSIRVWCCHHRLETHDENGNRRTFDITRHELKEKGLYFNRPASELILLPRKIHYRLHKEHISKRRAETPYVVSDETRKKISRAHKGRVSPMKGRKKSIESNRKTSASMLGHVVTQETRKKISCARKGKRVIIIDGHKYWVDRE